jgi:hypothetical protein
MSDEDESTHQKCPQEYEQQRIKLLIHKKQRKTEITEAFR